MVTISAVEPEDTYENVAVASVRLIEQSVVLSTALTPLTYDACEGELSDETVVAIVSPGDIRRIVAVEDTSIAVAVCIGTASNSHDPLLRATAHDLSVTVAVIG